MKLTELDRRIIAATQAGLPLVPEPYRAVASGIGIPAEEVRRRLARMLEEGVVRRIAAVPNHYSIGFRFNGMTVWDVEDERIGELGPRVGTMEIVSHCYRRPRIPGLWSYNLFAMVHGASREEVEAKAGLIAAELGSACRGSEILYSKRILKKTGFRGGQER